jgi:hypothetical protein
MPPQQDAMSRLAFFALFVTAACVTAPQPAGEEFVWACPSGTFTTRFDQSYTTALVFTDTAEYRLFTRSAAAGMRFGDGDIEFWENLRGAQLTGAPGGDLLDCELEEE